MLTCAPPLLEPQPATASSTSTARNGFAISCCCRRPPRISRFGLRPSLLKRAAWQPLELEDDDRVHRQEDAEEDGPRGQVPPHQRAAAEGAAATADAERAGEACVLAGVQEHQ